ncbi:MAG: hypothetical protein LBR33_10635 [Propionibacteriaceae bacterium]|jgi:hypothetical protein|nr:hypothetical protein [Propionibacteriaceae bacterium]
MSGRGRLIGLAVVALAVVGVAVWAVLQWGPRADAGPEVGASVDPAAIVNDPDLRAQVKVTACAREADGRWTARGEVADGLGRDQALVITISYTNADATVLDRRQVTVDVGEGESVAWSVTSAALEEENVTCVLRGVG